MPLSQEELLREQSRINERVITQFGILPSEVNLLGQQTKCLLSTLKEYIAKHGALMALESREAPSIEWLMKRGQALAVMFAESMQVASQDEGGSNG